MVGILGVRLQMVLDVVRQHFAKSRYLLWFADGIRSLVAIPLPFRELAIEFRSFSAGEVERELREHA